MTTETIQKVQALLTVYRNGDRKKIINVEPLLKRHGAEAVVCLLNELLKEKRKTLVALFDADESRFGIDEIIATLFRLFLAIKRLEQEGDEAGIASQELNGEQKEKSIDCLPCSRETSTIGRIETLLFLMLNSVLSQTGPLE